MQLKFDNESLHLQILGHTMKKYVLILILLPLVAFQTHKYYLSLTKIDYIKETKSIQITARIFIDDLEAALNKKYDKSFELDTNKELNNADEYINDYISKLLIIKINNNINSFNYLGKKYETDVVYLYAEIENISAIKSIEVQNKILMDNFPDQKNIIKLNINDQKKSFILTSDSDKDLLNF